MFYFMTWALRTRSPSIISVLYSMSPSIHMPGEIMVREQSCIGIIIWLIKNSRISFPFISPTCYIDFDTGWVIVLELSSVNLY